MNSIDTSVLDGIIVGRVEPHIYAFSTGTVPNYLKVGDTYRPVNVRLNEWRKFYQDLEPLYEHIAKLEDGQIFRDYSVHYYLENDKKLQRLESGLFPLVYYSREFFKDAKPSDIDEAIDDINRSAKENDGKYKFYSSDYLPQEFHYSRETTPWDLRPNQKETVDTFKNAISKGRTNLLMYAVMRFGKSFTSICCADAINAKFVVVLSAKADVKNEWKKTVEQPANFSNFVFLDASDLLTSSSIVAENISKGKQVVVFVTLQDLQGDNIKDKHKELFGHTIDLLIVDETHYGARAEEYGKILRNSNLKKAEIDKELCDIEDSEKLDCSIKQFSYKAQLHLSGTPYRILMGDEFDKEDIVTFCQFTDIVNEQKKWDEQNLANESIKEWDNPYYGFPQMIRFAFNPNKSSRDLLEKLRKEGNSYAFSELFRPQSITKDIRNSAHKRFVHEQEVFDLLKVIDGSAIEENVLAFLDYDKIKDGSMCRHMVMVLPFRASCDCVESLIRRKKSTFKNLQDYVIINIAGVDGDRSYPDTQSVTKAIAEAEKKGKKTLTLTVNRMLTGSTVEQWDTMLFLKDTASPQEYDQAIFRIQNQYIKTYINNDGDKVRFNMKPQTLLVDFDPARLFRLQELKSQFYNVNTDIQGNTKLEHRIQEELNISPIIVLNQNKIKEVTPADIMDAVRDYSQSKSVLEEAVEIPFDANLLNDPTLKGEIQEMNDIDAKKGLNFKPISEEDEEDDLETPEDGSNPQDSSENKPDTNNEAPKNDTEDIDWEKKLSAYYSKILFYAFLSETKLSSLEELIDSLAVGDDNPRIAKNLGIRARSMRILNDKCNPFILSKLDYKIQNINSLMRDTSLPPLERAKVAVKKFTRISSTEVVTPVRLANELVSFIPNEQIDTQSVFFDIASVQGEMAIAIYERFNDVEGIQNKIFSLTTSPLAYELTRKMYVALGMPIENIFSGVYADNLLDDNSTLQQQINAIHPTVIIGGPPFNKTDGGGRGDSGSALYHRYFEVAQTYNPRYISMFMKAVWYSGGKAVGLNEFRENMLNDHRLAIFHDYPDPTELQIEGTSLRGGVCSFLWDSGHNGTCHIFNHINGVVSDTHRYMKTPGVPIFIRYNHGLSILNKVQEKNLSTYGVLASSRDPYDLGDSFKDYTHLEGNDYNTEDYYRLYCVKKEIGYMRKSILKNEHKESANSWKVVVAKASPGTDTLPHSVISAPIISEPNSICSGGLIVVRKVRNEKEAKNLIAYMRTKFFRFMMLLAKNGHNMTKDVYRFVPDLPLSKEWTDRKLYNYFGIDKDEQQFINSVIKDVHGE